MQHPIPRETASWAYVFGSAAHNGLRASACYGNSSRADLCAIGRRGVEQSANPEPPSDARMVHSGPARLGFEFHAGHRADPHGAGISLRSLQVSARADVDSRHLPSADDIGDGVHRPSAAIRPGRLLGAGNRGLHIEPHTDRGSRGRKAIVGRPDHSGRHSLAFLRISRLCDSWLADRVLLDCICCWS